MKNVLFFKKMCETLLCIPYKPWCSLFSTLPNKMNTM